MTVKGVSDVCSLSCISCSVFLFVIVYMTFAPYSADYYVLRKGIGRSHYINYMGRQ